MTGFTIDVFICEHISAIAISPTVSECITRSRHRCTFQVSAPRGCWERSLWRHDNSPAWRTERRGKAPLLPAAASRWTLRPAAGERTSARAEDGRAPRPPAGGCLKYGGSGGCWGGVSAARGSVGLWQPKQLCFSVWACLLSGDGDAAGACSVHRAYVALRRLLFLICLILSGLWNISFLSHK